MMAVDREDLGVRVERGAFAQRPFGVWLAIAVVILVMTALALVAFTMVGTPSGPSQLPMPQPAPVGP
jgi:hypothetical protein